MAQADGRALGFHVLAPGARPAGFLTMLTVPDSAEAHFLEALTGRTPQSALTVRLYTAVSPAIRPGTVAGHVVEAAGGGLVSQPLTAANWTTTPGTPGRSWYTKLTFTFSGPLAGGAALLGYYVTRADGALQWIEPMPVPFTPATNGDSIDLTPVLTLGSLTHD